MLVRRRLWLVPAGCFIVLVYYYLLIPSSRDIEPYYGNVHWQKRPERYPVKKLTSLPSTSNRIPPIQFDFATSTETAAQKSVRDGRRQKIRDAFVHAWTGYKEHAFGKDEVTPLTGSYKNSFGGWGATLVDTLDTLWILGMKEDFEAAVEATLKIDFTANTEKDLNVFETTIRYLGGMLSAYDLSGGQYPALLEKAAELGEILYSAFDTPNHFPVCRWDWRKHAMGGQLLPADFTLLAEIGSLSLEFTRLSQLTGDMRYYDAIARISQVMANEQDGTLLAGLWPTIVDAKNLRWDFNHFTLGGMADSTYEYLPKEYMLLNGADRSYRTMYEKAMDAAERFLFFRPMVPGNERVLFSGTSSLTQQGQASLDPQGQHLTCFTAGMVGIGSRIFERPGDLTVAKELLDGCIWAYNATPSGLMPETFHVAPCGKGASSDLCEWDEDKYFAAVTLQQVDPSDGSSVNSKVSPVEQGRALAKEKNLLPGFTAHGDNRYILRPEAIESVFILYRITGDQRYQDHAWRMWEAIDRATRTNIANAAVVDVRMQRPEQSDRMESFWLAETLKYFYLVFAEPDEISLDEWVLNTEAHPFRRPKGGSG